MTGVSYREVTEALSPFQRFGGGGGVTTLGQWGVILRPLWDKRAKIKPTDRRENPGNNAATVIVRENS